MLRNINIFVAALASSLLLSSLAWAADAAPASEAPVLPAGPYDTMGAPSNPKVPAQWNRYHDSRDITALFKALAAAYPEYAKLSSLGKSFGGRDMWLLTVTDPSSGDVATKPGFWIDGCIHANEIQ